MGQRKCEEHRRLDRILEGKRVVSQVGIAGGNEGKKTYETREYAPCVQHECERGECPEERLRARRVKGRQLMLHGNE